MRPIVLAVAGATLLWLGAGLRPDPAVAASERPIPGPVVMRQLAIDRGCTTCHREKPPSSGEDSALPMAPSWQQIAARYRQVPDAQHKLEQLVLTGSDPNDRHWKNDAAFDRMIPNEIATTPEEANLLVRWILGFR